MLELRGKFTRVEFVLCGHTQAACSVRLSQGSNPAEDIYAEDVFAYLASTPSCPMAAKDICIDTPFVVDLYQPHNVITGGHLLLS